MKIILHGYKGKMGRCFADLTEGIVAGVDLDQTQGLAFPTFTSLAEIDLAADVVVDFTNAGAVEGLLMYCVDKKLPLVLCTTGLDDKLNALVAQASYEIPVFKSSNMSIGINVINRALRQITSPLYELGFDIEIMDFHHNQKVDAPSGTAYLLAETINNTLYNPLDINLGRSDLKEKRKKEEIGIHSLRGGTVAGKHNVIFAGDNEIIELSHIAQNRDIFAKGAIAAAGFIVGKPAGVYSMDDLLDGIVNS